MEKNVSSYIVYQFDSVLIPSQYEQACLAAINNLFSPEALARHAKRNFGEASYSAVDTPAEPFTSLTEAIEAWRFGSEKTSKGTSIANFLGQKWHDERILFEAIAPYVADGAFIIMAAEGDMDIFVSSIDFSEGKVVRASENTSAFRLMWSESGWKRHDSRSILGRYEEPVSIEFLPKESSYNISCSWEGLTDYVTRFSGNPLSPAEIDLLQRLFGRCTSMAIGFFHGQWYFAPSNFSDEKMWRDFEPCPSTVLRKV